MRDVGVVHLLERLDDVAGAQPLGIEGQDLIVHLGKAALALAHELRFERAIAVTRRLNRDFAVLAFQAFGGGAVAAVAAAAPGRGMLLTAEMLIQLGVQRRLDGQLDQLLGEGPKVLLGLDVLGQLGDQGFEFVLIHHCAHYCYPRSKVGNNEQLHNLIYSLGSSRESSSVVSNISITA